MRFAWTTALRELRGGLSGFRIFLACLVLGVGGIAAVGSVTAAIERGLASEGRTILGGDAALRFTYRMATDDERAWMDARGTVVEMVTMRSMLGEGEQRALSEVKAVSGPYPLYGELVLSEGTSLTRALAPQDGLHGLLTEPILADRLGLSIGDAVKLGGGTLRFAGRIESEPDRASAGFAMGPRVLTSVDGLREAGLLLPGVVFQGGYRLKLPPETDLEATEAAFREAFPESGARWRDRRAAAPGISRFVQRIGAFLTIVGLAALAIGGVGVGAAVRGYLERKVPVIAALRTLGASAGTVFAIYLIQIGLLSLLGIAIGLLLGGGLVALLGPMIAADLPIPANFSIYPARLAEAAVYGVLASMLFTLWPLAWLREVRPAELFRHETITTRRWPRPEMLVVMGALSALTLAAVLGLSASPKLAMWCIGALAGAFVLLRGLGWLCARLARRLSHSALGRRHPGLRLALGSIGAPGAGTPGVILALGLGLGVLSTIGQIDANMQRLIRDQLPENSPAFFFVDIQNAQLGAFREMVGSIDGTDEIATAPMLRGIVTELDGVAARDAKIDPAGAWVLRGDRGVSYAPTLPPGAVLTDGQWWAADYAGPPLVSFAEEEGRELGLDIGKTVTVNILGRPITATVANFRKVEWRGLGINFLMILSPGALAGAPHTHIATVHADREAEAPILRALGREMPNVTAVQVREQVARVSDGLGKIGAAIRWGALAVLLTGLAVLIGTAAADEKRRTSEAAILKVLGATRAAILTSFALRAVLTGLLAGIVALGWGTVSAWAVTTYVLDADFVVELGQAIVVIAIGIALSLTAGMVFAWGPLRRKPAGVLRTEAG